MNDLPKGNEEEPLGLVYFRSGDYDRSIAYLQKLVALAPDAEYNQYALGRAYYELGDYDQSITHLQKAVELVPECTYIQVALGRAEDRKRGLGVENGVKRGVVDQPVLTTEETEKRTPHDDYGQNESEAIM